MSALRWVSLVFVFAASIAGPVSSQTPPWPSWADGIEDGNHWPPTSAIYQGLAEEVLFQANDGVTSIGLNSGDLIYSVNDGVLALREYSGAKIAFQSPLAQIVTVRQIPSDRGIGDPVEAVLLLGLDASGISCAYVSAVAASGTPSFSWDLVYAFTVPGPIFTAGDVVGDSAYLVDGSTNTLFRVGDGDGSGLPDFAGAVVSTALAVAGVLPLVDSIIENPTAGGSKIIVDKIETEPVSVDQYQISETSGGMTVIVGMSGLPAFIPELPGVVGGPVVAGQRRIALRYGESAARVWVENSAGMRISTYGAVSVDAPVTHVELTASLIAGSTIRLRSTATSSFGEVLVESSAMHLFAIEPVEVEEGDAFVLSGANLSKTIVYEYRDSPDFSIPATGYQALQMTHLSSDQVMLVAPSLGASVQGGLVHIRATEPATGDVASAWILVADPVEIPE